MWNLINKAEERIVFTFCVTAATIVFGVAAAQFCFLKCWRIIMKKSCKLTSLAVCSAFISLCAFSFMGVVHNAEAGPIVYPAKGQSEAQQTKDQGECHEWAIKQTGVDPANLAAEASSGEVYQRHHTALGGAARGALGGLAIGAIAGDAGKGAAIGAGVGAVGGGLRGRRDLEMQHQVTANAHADQQAQLQEYDRAYSACLTGRGYTIK